ncbi:MAG: cytochrome c5 family protein [Gammaproteobacteria bacterium]|nr:cytochrome c5 family protein [Gammaproteobacteria bacterium]
MSIVKSVLAITLASNLLLLVGCGEDAEKAEAVQQLALGEELYKKNCKVCHAQGLNGAPIVGNKKMWGPRAEQGLETLVEHATNGFGLMPAKGGKTELADSDISAVVKYMLSQIQ